MVKTVQLHYNQKHLSLHISTQFLHIQPWGPQNSVSFQVERKWQVSLADDWVKNLDQSLNLRLYDSFSNLNFLFALFPDFRNTHIFTECTFQQNWKIWAVLKSMSTVYPLIWPLIQGLHSWAQKLWMLNWEYEQCNLFLCCCLEGFRWPIDPLKMYPDLKGVCFLFSTSLCSYWWLHNRSYKLYSLSNTGFWAFHPTYVCELGSCDNMLSDLFEFPV